MSRIVFISTYRDLSVMAKSVAEELGITVEFYEGWLEQAREILNSLSGPPVDVLMSRGGTAEYLAKKTSIPVVRVNIGPYDILEGLDEARQYSRNIAITTWNEPLAGLRLLEKVMDVSITEVVFENLDSLEKRLRSLADADKYCVIGGGPSVSYAQNYGLPSVFLRTNRATLHSAFINAGQLAALRKEETRKAFRLNAILDAVYDGIVAVDAAGTVEIYNKAAEKALGIASDKVIGQNVVDVIPNTRLEGILRTGQGEIGEIHTIGNTKFLTNRVPIKNGYEMMGAVATFQESSKVVQAEQKIRKDVVKYGQFRAKACFSDIIGHSNIMEVKKKIAKNFAASDLTVLLYGASGTGKELFAQSIHNASSRAANPFVAVNCGALPPTLLESELFGYEEGAFTGARRKGKYGLFELAHGGSIFLDEIDALPIEMQGRLLRVLQEREVLRIGGEAIIPVNVRVIAATNKTPDELVEKQLIREDLLYRLDVLYIEIPPLSERREDIQSLCEHFLPPGENKRLHLMIARLQPYFQKYSWPGNIRELFNVVQRLSFFADSFDGGQGIEDFLKTVAPRIYAEVKRPQAENDTFRGKVKGLEDELILTAVKEQKTLDRAAAFLGIGRSTLTRRLKHIREHARE